jgi:hypothetical protein
MAPRFGRFGRSAHAATHVPGFGMRHALSELRRRHNAFVTPQSYRFLRERELPSLLNGQLRQLDALATI